MVNLTQISAQLRQCPSQPGARHDQDRDRGHARSLWRDDRSVALFVHEPAHEPSFLFCTGKLSASTMARPGRDPAEDPANCRSQRRRVAGHQAAPSCSPCSGGTELLIRRKWCGCRRHVAGPAPACLGRSAPSHRPFRPAARPG